MQLTKAHLKNTETDEAVERASHLLDAERKKLHDKNIETANLLTLIATRNILFLGFGNE